MSMIKIPTAATIESINDIFHRAEETVNNATGKRPPSSAPDRGTPQQQPKPTKGDSNVSKPEPEPQAAWKTGDPQALRELYGLGEVPEDIDAEHMAVFLMMTRAKQIQGYISTIAQDQGNLQIETEEMAAKLEAVKTARFGDKSEDSRAALLTDLEALPYWTDIKKDVRVGSLFNQLSNNYDKERLTDIAAKETSWWSKSYKEDFSDHGQIEFYNKYNIHNDTRGRVVVSRELIERAKTFGIDILANTNNDADDPDSELGAYHKDYVLVTGWDLGALIQPMIKDGGDLSTDKQKKEVELDPQTRQWLIDHDLPPPPANADEKEWDSYQSSIEARITNNQNQMQVVTRELTKLTHYMTQYMEMASQMQASAHRDVMAWVNALRI